MKSRCSKSGVNEFVAAHGDVPDVGSWQIDADRLALIEDLTAAPLRRVFGKCYHLSMEDRLSLVALYVYLRVARASRVVEVDVTQHRGVADRRDVDHNRLRREPDGAEQPLRVDGLGH